MSEKPKKGLLQQGMEALFGVPREESKDSIATEKCGQVDRQGNVIPCRPKKTK
jgi:hypothetical protein